jgi:23S rRNA U2552 (ribose-2'-O)-methylase RlmE/FtsJ
MHSHDSDITAIMFCGREGELLASVSAGAKSQLLVSEWSRMFRRFSIYLPSRSRK